MCYSPFGFEDIGLPFTATQGILFGMDTDDELLKTPQNAEEYAKINGLLNGNDVTFSGSLWYKTFAGINQ